MRNNNLIVSSQTKKKTGFPLETRDQRDLVGFYGEVADMNRNLVMIDLPFPMRIAWDKAKTINKMRIHRKCAESLFRIFQEIWVYYNKNLTKIQKDGIDLFGGSFNARKMRGANRWSSHSWGCAIDLDPDRNQLKWGRDRASMPDHVIAIFAKHGWENLGALKNFDFMHFQACYRAY